MEVLTVPTITETEEMAALLGLITGVAAYVSECTCCRQPRLAARFGDPREEWGHLDDLNLWRYVSRHEPSGAYGDDYVEIRLASTRVEWHRRTDEGSEGGTAHVCSDPWCAHEGRSQRDYSAERMGY